MTDISTQYSDTLTTLQQEVYDRLESLGIDPSDINLFSVDGELNVDLLSMEELQPFFQLAVMQLAAILVPDKINADSFETMTIEELPDVIGTELYNWIVETVTDDPELMMYFSGSDAEAEAIANIIYSDDFASTSDTEDEDALTFEATDARAFNEEHDVGGGYEWYINSYEASQSGVLAILDRMDDVAQARMALAEAMLDPEAAGKTLEQLELESEQLLQSEQTLTNMLSQLQNGMSTITQLFSKIIEQTTEVQLDTARKIA